MSQYPYVPEPDRIPQTPFWTERVATPGQYLGGSLPTEARSPGLQPGYSYGGIAPSSPNFREVLAGPQPS
jgi:hypothetical protein